MKERTLTEAMLLAVLGVLVASGSGAWGAAAPIPLIVDDDGSADGMIALLCVLQDPRFDVQAVTIAQGLAHPDVFAPLVQRMLARVGRPRIPVGVGRLKPLAGANAFPELWRGDTDRFWGVQLPELDNPPAPRPAAELIAQVIRRAPEPVAILATGPLTNVAEALRRDPGLARNIRLVEVMGGAVWVAGNVGREWPEIDNQTAEWNIWVDPVAAREVVESGVPVRFVPLDVTNKIIYTAADGEMWKAKGTPEGLLAVELLAYLLKQISPTGVSVWDAVAAADLCNPRCLWPRPVHLDVLTEPGPRHGQTLLVPDEAPNCQAGRRPRPERVKAQVADLLGR